MTRVGERKRTERTTDTSRCTRVGSSLRRYSPLHYNTQSLFSRSLHIFFFLVFDTHTVSWLLYVDVIFFFFSFLFCVDLLRACIDIHISKSSFVFFCSYFSLFLCLSSQCLLALSRSQFSLSLCLCIFVSLVCICTFFSFSILFSPFTMPTS